MINAGELRHRVTLQERDSTPDAHGDFLDNWTQFAELWAKVEPIRGNERFDAAKYRSEVTHRVTIRLSSYEMLAAGFQASFRLAEGTGRGRSAGSARPLDERVAVVPGPAGLAEYVQHTRMGTATEDDVAEWTFEWTGPTSGQTVALHVSANSGSGDNSPLDDLVFTHEAILESAHDR